jgi:hypothetical protein
VPESADHEARELFFHEDDHAKDRTDWFFIGHAILLEAFLTACSATKSLERQFAFPLALVGLASSLVWLLVGARQKDNLEAMRKLYAAHSTMFKEEQEARGNRDDASSFNWKHLGRASRLLLVGLPVVFTLFWGYAIHRSCCAGPSTICSCWYR